MTKREKRKKIFYVPGMISLVLIPLVCFYHFYKVDAFKDERCIDINIPSDSIEIKNFLSLKRDYQVFNFQNSLDLERNNLNKLQFALRNLNRTNDTIKGIQIHLGKKMKYEVYIRILDIFIIEKMLLYTQYKDDFFVVMLPKPKPSNAEKIVPIVCGYWEANKDYFLEEERKAKLKYIISLYEKYWIVFLGYFGIVLINIFALVKFNKNQNYNQK
ncbi:hypothetical protein L1276_004649 [Flavobacterium sp. HSC-32F16]|uniref:hypothetical protein n=1 Tax=Flavobacterium sp. HSC-32F16 TaxID=2910964 RepID=UPI0020A4A593|nr:hypothetical protein [Flavobacterium sp. HSC-32F16]MCP2029462.1 hypothetical protein [Flavobacterium sp. HSC-32F16]